MSYYNQGLVVRTRVGAETREPHTWSILGTLALVGFLFYKAGKAVS